MNRNRWRNSLATWDSSSLCCLHFTACQNVMIAVCTISLFPFLQAQNSAAWADEKRAWWQTKEQCEFCHTRGCTNSSQYLKCNKKNRKKSTYSNIKLLKFFFFCNTLKWKHFLLEILYDHFKWKVMPFRFLPWTPMISLNCSLLHFPPSFFLFLTFFTPHYPLSQKKE